MSKSDCLFPLSPTEVGRFVIEIRCAKRVRTQSSHPSRSSTPSLTSLSGFSPRGKKYHAPVASVIFPFYLLFKFNLFCSIRVNRLSPNCPRYLSVMYRKPIKSSVNIRNYFHSCVVRWIVTLWSCHAFTDIGKSFHFYNVSGWV